MSTVETSNTRMLSWRARLDVADAIETEIAKTDETRSEFLTVAAINEVNRRRRAHREET